MSVLFLDHCARPAGAQMSLQNMIAAGVRGNVILLEQGPMVARFQELGVEVHVDELNGEFQDQLLGRGGLRTVVKLPRALWRIRRKIRQRVAEENAEILILNSLRVTLLAAASGVTRRLPTVVMVRDGLAPPYMSRMMSFLCRSVLRLASTEVVANSSWTASKTGLKNVRVVSPFVSPEFFSTEYTTDGAESSDSDRKIRVLLLGRIAPWKGQDLLFGALPHLTAGRDYEFSIAGAPLFGEHDYAQELENQREGWREIVALLGHRDDVIELIDGHDIVLHTSIAPEPFGQVVLQGMARGKVVIAANLGGPAELIEDGVDGYLYEAGSRLGVAQSLSYAIDNYDKLSALRSNAVRSASAHAPSVGAAQMHELIANVAGRRSTS
jgi:glycosyltransferase involved in cell wall biosynthesis